MPALFTRNRCKGRQTKDLRSRPGRFVDFMSMSFLYFNASSQPQRAEMIRGHMSERRMGSRFEKVAPTNELFWANGVRIAVEMMMWAVEVLARRRKCDTETMTTGDNRIADVDAP